jgi:acyl carrier protein
MKLDKSSIVELIYKAIEEVNSQEDDPSKVIVKSLETVLIGPDGSLDSLGLVNFIVALEGIISDEINTDIALVDERAMMLENSPFRTVNSLAEYVNTLTKELA